MKAGDFIDRHLAVYQICNILFYILLFWNKKVFFVKNNIDFIFPQFNASYCVPIEGFRSCTVESDILTLYCHHLQLTIWYVWHNFGSYLFSNKSFHKDKGLQDAIQIFGKVILLFNKLLTTELPCMTKPESQVTWSGSMNPFNLENPFLQNSNIKKLCPETLRKQFKENTGKHHLFFYLFSSFSTRLQDLINVIPGN